MNILNQFFIFSCFYIIIIIFIIIYFKYIINQIKIKVFFHFTTLTKYKSRVTSKWSSSHMTLSLSIIPTKASFKLSGINIWLLSFFVNRFIPLVDFTYKKNRRNKKYKWQINPMDYIFILLYKIIIYFT